MFYGALIEVTELLTKLYALHLGYTLRKIVQKKKNPVNVFIYPFKEFFLNLMCFSVSHRIKCSFFFGSSRVKKLHLVFVTITI